MYGQERKRLMDDADKKIVAYHEAGHALVQAFLDDGSAPIHKVTIIPRGASLGSTMFAPTKDKLNHGKKSLLRQLATLYGGRIAEEEVLGDISSGAAGDIQQATRIAQHMVCDWGMSSLGPIMLESRGEVPGERAAHQYSQETALEIDKAVQVMLKEQYDVAREIINSHRDMLEKIAQALLVSETIDGAMVMDIIGRGKTHPGPDTPGTGAA
jgi:cell division protease FtsH